MTYTINKSGSDAAYLQLADALKERRRNREQILPPFRQLAAEYGVSLGVVQRAVQQLQKESLLQISRSVGSRWVEGARPEPELQKFGIIHPYSENSDHLLVLNMALNQALSNAGLNGVGIFRSSGGTSSGEVEQAEWLLKNRVRGILLSPAAESDPACFESLAGKLPVVAIENALPGSTLPAVIHDYRGAGREIVAELKRRQRRRLLILLDHSENNSIVEITRVLQENLEGAKVLRLPLLKLKHPCTAGDYRLFNTTVEKLENLLSTGDFDSVFCPYDEHFDKLFMLGVHEKFRTGILPVVICCNRPAWYTENMFRSGTLFWAFCPDQFMETVIQRIVNWNAGHQRTTGVKRIKLRQINPVYKSNKSPE